MSSLPGWSQPTPVRAGRSHGWSSGFEASVEIAGDVALEAAFDFSVGFAERDPVVLAGLARGVLRNKTDDLRLALAGRFTAHHGQTIGFHLARLDHLDQMIGQVREKIGPPGTPGTSRRAATEPAGLLAPFAAQIRLLTSIPGISDRVAAVIVSEIGVDMSRFPSAKHLAAWAGLAPGNNESGGRRRQARHRKGNTHVQSILIEAALCASRTRTRLGARFHRLHRRFDGKANKTAAKKAGFAVAHTLIKVIWTVLATGQPYTDLGHDYYTRRVNPETHARDHVTVGADLPPRTLHVGWEDVCRGEPVSVLAFRRAAR